MLHMTSKNISEKPLSIESRTFALLNWNEKNIAKTKQRFVSKKTVRYASGRKI